MSLDLNDSQLSQSSPLHWLNLSSNNQTVEAILEQALPWFGEQLQCDRVFLYARSPKSQLGRVPYSWQRHADVPKIFDPNWKLEPPSLPSHDPMFAAALQAQPSLFIEDVETASPEQVNRDFEQQNFGHRALIHAHLCIERKLWGILQACVFDHPRVWSRDDRSLTEQMVGWFAPLTREYVSQHAPAVE